MREFSKETVPSGTFEALQTDILGGVQPVADCGHSSPYIRLNKVVEQAMVLALANNPLMTVTTNLDRHGVCHQLSNDDKIDWEPDA